MAKKSLVVVESPAKARTINKYLGREIVAYIKSENFQQYEDCKLYNTLVSSGKFYPFMEERFKENQIPYEDRKDLKQQLFVVFFGKILAYKYNKAAALF